MNPKNYFYKPTINAHIYSRVTCSHLFNRYMLYMLSKADYFNLTKNPCNSLNWKKLLKF